MLTKTAIALATALTLGFASAAMAVDNDQKGGYRELGPGGAAESGLNPALHPEAAVCAKKYKSYDASTMTYIGKDGKRHPCGV